VVGWSAVAEEQPRPDQFMPSNLIAFDSPDQKIAENPALPENQRDVQYT